MYSQRNFGVSCQFLQKQYMNSIHQLGKTTILKVLSLLTDEYISLFWSLIFLRIFFVVLTV